MPEEWRAPLPAASLNCRAAQAARLPLLNDRRNAAEGAALQLQTPELNPGGWYVLVMIGPEKAPWPDS